MSGQTSNPATDKRILAVQGLTKYFPITSGLLRRVTGYVRAVDDVNLYVNAGETLSIVGESGSGKTTLGRMIVRAIDPTRGEIMLKTDDSTWVDLAKLQGKELRAVRRHFHMIFQDPSASLNPRMRVRDIVMEPLLSSVPIPDPNRKPGRIALKGEVPNPANPPSGYYFHPRCPYATDLCVKEPPPLREIVLGRFAACHYAETLELKGMLSLHPKETTPASVQV
jgi:oligopeptide/dipeptide ABC transporter ATP-binding protein